MEYEWDFPNKLTDEPQFGEKLSSVADHFCRVTDWGMITGCYHGTQVSNTVVLGVSLLTYFDHMNKY